ncbi:MAG: nucleotide pyrophosphohydrolase [Acholeplasmatales bacterium]|nr:MAG: nucleotide pyrophosphohydrolase [Acholeplasmatales bacterium]
MEKLLEKLRAFRDARDWKPYHTPENLAKSITIEAGELLELFQWEPEAKDVDRVKEELADILNYCLLLSDHYGFDLETIILEKIAKNEVKYPIHKAKGNATKYTEFGEDSDDES